MPWLAIVLEKIPRLTFAAAPERGLAAILKYLVKLESLLIPTSDRPDSAPAAAATPEATAAAAGVLALAQMGSKAVLRMN